MPKPDDDTGNLLVRLLRLVGGVLKGTFRRFKQLHILGKLVVCFLTLVIATIISIFIIIGPDKVAQTLYDTAQKLANLPFGWLILGLIVTVTSFPPLIGHTTTTSLCGFAYGLKGFLIAAPATVIGSAIVFVVLRLLFKKRLVKWTAENEKWQALETVVRNKGLPLIILVRVSPFPPWVYSNALFASIQAVALWQFVFATLFVLPKIFLVVFVASRIAHFSDGKQRGEMDKTAKILDAVSVVVGVLLAATASIVVYLLMQRQIRELRESPDVDDELAAEALEEAEEGAPLLHNMSSDSVNVASA